MHDKFELEDDFEELSNSENVDLSEKPPHLSPIIGWRVDEGMNSYKMRKLYSLLSESSSLFYLGHALKREADGPKLTDAYSFVSRDNDHRVILYKPDGTNVAVYNTGNTNEEGVLHPPLESHLKEMKQYCAQAKYPVRFVMPFTEMPSDFGKAPSHAILLVVDYDPSSKELTPVVYDSIGRGTISDSLSSLFKSKTRSTADGILNERIQALFHDDALKVVPLRREAYNHQNRATEGNCGSYTFRSVFEAMHSFASNTSMKIPSSGYITSDSYLTPQHVKEIEHCVNYRSMPELQVETRLSSLGLEIKLTELERKQQTHEAIGEFLEVLQAYATKRAQEPEKSRFNFKGYSKADKLEAVAVMAEILRTIDEGKDVSFLDYQQYLKYKSVIEDGTLGQLVAFHAHHTFAKDLGNVLVSHVSYEDDFDFVDDFEVIHREQGDDLFDVPDIDGKKLATNHQPCAIKHVVVNEEIQSTQKTMKESFKEIRANHEEEHPGLVQGVKQ